MKVFIQNNNSLKSQKQKIAFEAGLTPKMIQEIKNTDVLEISGRLAQKGISTDFKGNKVIAWCSNKTLEIFENINKKYRPKLALPKGIYAEDFERLNIDTPSDYGFCNLAPTELRKNSGEIVPSRVVFFNTSYNWDNVDKIADFRYEKRQAGTDLFLYSFLHEFTHASHEDRLLKKFNGKILLKKILDAKDLKQIQEYQRKYGQKIVQISRYALTDPMEAIACDMPKIIAESLDKETLMPIKNPFIGTPYENMPFWKRIYKYSDKDRPLKEILRNFWGGKFE